MYSSRNTPAFICTSVSAPAPGRSDVTHQIRARASRAVLHDNPQSRAFEIRAMVSGVSPAIGERVRSLGHEFAVELPENLDLLLNIINLVLCAL